MGAQIDSANPLYGGGAGGMPPASESETRAPAPAKPNLDFDLDSAPTDSAPDAAASSFDLDLGAENGAQPDLPVSGDAPPLDFDLAPPETAAGDDSRPGTQARDEKSAFDFDLSGLDMPASKPAGASSPDLDLGGGSPGDAGASALNLTDLDLGEGGGAGGDAVTTKLELAKAYLEIGDKDGAREILQEVAKEGSAAQKAEAQKLIASL